MSFVPEYQVHALAEKQTAFLLYPINLGTKNKIAEIVDVLVGICKEFEEKVIEETYRLNVEAMDKPIR